MEHQPTFTGIDISKLTLDICVLHGKTKKHTRINNEPDAIRMFFTSLTAEHGSLQIGMENTGCYNYNLYWVMGELGLPYFVIPPMHLKKSMGLTRGKNDKVDALRIAMFLELNIRSLHIYKPRRATVTKLQLLLTAREQRVKIKKQITGSGEQYQYLDEESTGLQSLDAELIVEMDNQIKIIEQQIQELIKDDAQLNASYKLISSVQGVGKVLSWNLLVTTGEFNDITEARKLACYAGVAPFEHSSGTSVRGRSRISQYADKGLKKLLHLAAMSAIRLEGDLRDYYQRKVADGKNKMSVLNAVRNKIIHRIYAVLKNNRPYQKYLTDPLAMS